MSKKNTLYRQCRLVRQGEGNSKIETVSHIPQKFAKVGWILSLKDNDDEWTEGWIVKQVGDLVSEPMDVRKLIKGHRKMTGDDTPRTKN